MGIGLIQTVAPTAEPVALADFIQWARAVAIQDSNLAASLLTAARQKVETDLRQQLMTATWQLVLDRFSDHSDDIHTGTGGGNAMGTGPWWGQSGPWWGDWDGLGPLWTGGGQVIRIPRAPLQSITSVQYIDTSGNLQTLPTSGYQVDTVQRLGRIMPAWGQFWPVLRPVMNAVTITFVAGYGAATDVPEAIKTAIKMLASHWLENREAVGMSGMSELPLGVQALLSPYWAGDYV